MRILVVDDEFFARKALIKMINRLTQNRYSIVEAENGRVAQEIISDQRFDLLISDIRMPEVNGLDLISWTRNHFPEMTAVIISGYSDFEYAQQAIRSKVIDYLLKPIDETQLEQVLLQAHSSWVRRMNPQNSKNTTHYNSIECEDIASVIFDHKPVSEQLLNKFYHGISDNPSGWYLAIIQITAVTNHGDNQNLKSILHDSLSDISLHNSLSGTILHVLWNASKDECLIIFSTEQPPEKLCQTIMCKLKMSNKLSLSMGISSQHNRIDDLSKSYQEALSMINQKIFYGWNRVFGFNHDVIRLDQVYLDKDDETKFRLYLLHGDKTSAIRIVQKFIHPTSKETPIRVLCFQEAFLRILLILHDVLRSFIDDQKEDMLPDERISLYNKLDISSFESLEEIEKYLNHLIEITTSAAKVKMEKKGSKKIVHEIIEYIENNYQSDIHFHELANKHFFKNPSYLSRIFKTHSGSTLSKYLISVRMDHAKILVKQSEMKISQIAKEVGYNDASHFIQMFKKSEGMTPEKYRLKTKTN